MRKAHVFLFLAPAGPYSKTRTQYQGVLGINNHKHLHFHVFHRYATLVFFLISMLLLISSIFPLFLDYQGTSTDVKKTPLEDFAEGFQFLKKEKVITGLIFIGLVPSIFGSTVNFLLPAFNQEVILGGPEELGVLSAGMGLGALIGSLLLAKLSDLGSKGQIMFLASYGWAITIAIFAFSGQ